MSIVLSCKTKLINRMILILIIICFDYSNEMNMKTENRIQVSNINEQLSQMKQQINMYYKTLIQSYSIHSNILLYTTIIFFIFAIVALYCLYKSKFNLNKEEKPINDKINNKAKSKLIKRKKKGVNIENYISFYNSLSNPSNVKPPSEYSSLLNS